MVFVGRFPFMFELVTAAESPRKGAIGIPGKTDKWIIPRDKAENLVPYLMSLKRDREPMKVPVVSGPPKRLVTITLYGLKGEIHVRGQKFQNVMSLFKDQVGLSETKRAIHHRKTCERKWGHLCT